MCIWKLIIQDDSRISRGQCFQSSCLSMSGMNLPDSSNKGPVIGNAKMMASLLFNWKAKSANNTLTCEITFINTHVASPQPRMKFLISCRTGNTMGFFVVLFQDSDPNSAFGQLWQKVERSLAVGHSYVLSDHVPTHLNHVKRGGFAFLNDITIALNQVGVSCDLAVLEELIWPFNYALGTQHNSAYQPVFSSV